MADGRRSCLNGFRWVTGAAAILAKGGRMTWIYILTRRMVHQGVVGFMWRKTGNCGILWRIALSKDSFASVFRFLLSAIVAEGCFQW